MFEAKCMIVLLLFIISSCESPCKVHYKPVVLNNGSISCQQLNDIDILRSLHYLANPTNGLSAYVCKKLTTIQGLSVCEDFINFDSCVVYSSISSTWCDHYGSLAFEKYWASKGCKVTLIHFTVYFKGNVCNNDNELKNIPNLTLIRESIWSSRCYNCLYKLIKFPLPKPIDIFKIQDREGVNEDYDGVQYTILSDIYLYMPLLPNYINQILFRSSINSMTLVDNVGREAEQAYNMWASSQILLNFQPVHTKVEEGRHQPLQFDYMLKQIELDSTIGSYVHTFIKYSNVSLLDINKKLFDSYQPKIPSVELHGNPPEFCKLPNKLEDDIMQRWIYVESRVRCHPTRLWVPCERNRDYMAFIPCPQDLYDYLATDYAIAKGWCNFNHSSANIEPLTKVDQNASAAFQLKTRPKVGVRLAFFFTIYRDAVFFERMFNHLYSSDHYYLIHIDPTGSTIEFERDIRYLASRYFNVFVAKDIGIVYGASTASILLTKAMAWFLENAYGWDYFVPLTGSDYPLLPLHRIEKIFNYQNPPMPFVMAWTPGTSTHLFRLGMTHPLFTADSDIAKSIDAVTDERGKVLGAVPMEYRSSNFGPPITCNSKRTFYHLDNRANKSGNPFDTQWLFPRDRLPGRGRAFSEEDYTGTATTKSFDGVFRVWKKSDPATTGAYDKESVDYIIHSEEGKKYFHFFKFMLLGSEEHYYVSLLYNWPRTKSFVQTLSSEIVWNTWEKGLWEQSSGFQTHTHFLSMENWPILKGFAKRGMMFARKFSIMKNKELIDKIDEYILLNKSTDAGLYWPGYFDVDITSPGKIWKFSYKKDITMRNRRKWEYPGSTIDYLGIKTSSFSNVSSEIVASVAEQGTIASRGKNTLNTL